MPVPADPGGAAVGLRRAIEFREIEPLDGHAPSGLAMTGLSGEAE